MKRYSIGILIAVILLAGIAYLTHSSPSPSTVPSPSTIAQPNWFDFDNLSFDLNKEQINLIHGLYLQSSHKVALSDLGASQTASRAAVIVVDNPGGSGIFYYLIGAMKQDQKAIYSTPVLLGDRIKLEALSLEEPQAHNNGAVTVTYYNRKPNQPMATEPTVKKTITYSFVDNGNLIEVLH